MAENLLAHEVSDLCIGKPPLKSLPESATVGEALACLKKCGESSLIVWKEESSEKKTCLGRISMADVICYFCSDENLDNFSAAALSSSVSTILPKNSENLVKHVERHSSVTEALDLILDGAEALIVPIKKPLHLPESESEFCLLVPEDFARFFLNSIAAFSSISSLSVSSLGIINGHVATISPQEATLSLLPLIRNRTAVAVVSKDGKLVGEISPTVRGLARRGSGLGAVARAGSSLVAVLVQALAHRVGHVWVVEEDFGLVGLVPLTSVLRIFRDIL